MDSIDPTKLQSDGRKSLKAENLDMISNFMDSILLNMKSHVHKVSTNDISFLNRGNLHLMNANNNIETLMDVKKPNKQESVGKPTGPVGPDKKPSIKNSQNQYKKRSSSLLRNVTKKITQIKSSVNGKRNFKSSSINQKTSPGKIQVVYKENDKFVTRSLSTMLKKANPPAVDKNRSRKTNNQSRVSNKISNNSTNIKRTSRVAKPINLINAPLQPLKSSTSTVSNLSKINSLPNKGKITDLTEKHVRRSRCNLRPISNSGFSYPNNRNNSRSASLNSKSGRKTPTSNQSKPTSRKSKTGRRSDSPKNKVQKSNQAKSSSDTNKFAPNQVQKQTVKPVDNKKENQVPKQTKTQIQNSIQNQDPIENVAQDVLKNQNKISQNQLLDQVQNLVQYQVQSLGQGQVLNETQNQLKHISQPTTDLNPIKIESKPIKFMKNTENINRHKLLANKNVENNSIKLINDKLEHLIDKIKEEKDIRANTIIQSNLNNNLPTPNLFIDKPVINNENKQIITNEGIKQNSTISNNKLVNKNKIIDNKHINNIDNETKQTIATEDIKQNRTINNNKQINKIDNKQLIIDNRKPVNNQLNSIKTKYIKNANPKEVVNKNIRIPPSVAPIVSTKFGTRVSKQSVQSCLIVRPSNQSNIPPNRNKSLTTPMEIVQDYINLVNKAKKERKTYTVCGNFHSVRRAFTQRGWIEKMRINLIDDPIFKKLENLSNFELVEGIKDRDIGDKYRKIFISKLLSGHQVDFYWDYMQNPFNVNNDKIKRTIINRLPYGATRAYTSKAGLCETLKEAYWYYVEGYANILFPRTYNLANEEEIALFTEDFRRTAAISLLQWITKNSDKPNNIISSNGLIQTSIFNFATLQCFNFIKMKEHKDIDEIIPMAKEYEWDIFLEKYYKIVHQGQHFKETDQMNYSVLIDQARYILNKIRRYVPHVDVDGVMNLWLLKPNNGSRGCGIHVCRTMKYALDTVSNKKDTRYVIQKYIERPLLIHSTKFDIRQWFLVTCMPNLQVWLYKDCYLRFSSQMYDLSKLHESIHLTNNSVQCRYKNQSTRHGLPDNNMWHSDSFKKYLDDIGQPAAWKIIYKGIRECLVGLFMLCQDKIITRVNSFELSGADFMVTEDFKPYLIEINSRPALYASTKITAQLCPKVLEDVVRVTVDYARNPKAPTGNFELIYKDSFNYIPPKNVNSIFIEGISHVKFANASVCKDPIDPCETTTIVSEPDPPGHSIEKILHIDPGKVRKDVKNTLEKILAIIQPEPKKAEDEDNQEGEEMTSVDKNKQFKMMLSEFVDIVTSVKMKQTEPLTQI